LVILSSAIMKMPMKVSCTLHPVTLFITATEVKLSVETSFSEYNTVNTDTALQFWKSGISYW